MPELPELTEIPPRGQRVALVIAASQYSDPALRQLRAPGQDANELAHVLLDPAIGGFDVVTLLNSTSEGVRRAVADFCADRSPDDLMLVYLSCHGLLDDAGRLYYALTDTERRLLSATALPATWLNERLEDCRCKRQVLVLDCCHSGAFQRNGKGDGELALRERLSGRGRVVLTASGAREYSFEGDDPIGRGVVSVFTHALITGLRTGEADLDRDGQITVAELYRYAYERVRRSGHPQKPELWAAGAEGDLVVASTRHGVVVDAALPQDLLDALRSERLVVREAAVAELATMMDAEPSAAQAARRALETVAAQDVPRVASAATAALTGSGGLSLPAPESPHTPTTLSLPARSLRPEPARQARSLTVPAAVMATTVACVMVAFILALVIWPGRGSGNSAGEDSAVLSTTSAPPQSTPASASQPASTTPTLSPTSVRSVQILVPTNRSMTSSATHVLPSDGTRTPPTTTPSTSTRSTTTTSNPEQTPGQVAWIQIPEATSTWIKMSWGEAKGAVTYTIGWRAVSGVHQGLTAEYTNYVLRGRNNPVKFSRNIDPGTTYEFWVAGVNNADMGPKVYARGSTLPGFPAPS